MASFTPAVAGGLGSRRVMRRFAPSARPPVPRARYSARARLENRTILAAGGIRGSNPDFDRGNMANPALIRAEMPGGRTGRPGAAPGATGSCRTHPGTVPNTNRLRSFPHCGQHSALFSVSSSRQFFLLPPQARSAQVIVVFGSYPFVLTEGAKSLPLKCAY